MDAKYVQCAAKSCGNKLLDRSDLTFFTFPKNVELAKIWARNSNFAYYYYGATLCAEHFEDTYFDDKYGKKTVFKENIEPIPTIFNIDKEREIPKQVDDSFSELLSNMNPDLEFGRVGSYTDKFIQTTNTVKSICTAYDFQKITVENNIYISNNNIEKSDVSQTLNLNNISEEFIYCRLCAKLLTANNLQPIYGASKYNELLEICLPGKVLETDELSHNICSPCVYKLKNCCIILKSFIKADEKLRNIRTEYQSILNKPSISHQTEVISDPPLIDILNVQVKEQIQFRCIKCPSVFDSKEEIVVHAFHSHPTSRGSKIISTIIKNKIVGKEPNQIKSKILMRNTIKKFQCIICLAILNTKEAVITHIKTQHKSLSSDNTLTKLIDLNEDKTINQSKFTIKYMCVSCPTIYDNKKDVTDHALLTHPQNKIVSKTILINRNESVQRNDILPLKIAPKVNQQKKLFNYSINNRPIFQNKFKPMNVNQSILRRPYMKHSNKESSEPTETFHIKYQCQNCPLLFKSYKEVLDHFKDLHTPLQESGLVALLVKVRDSTNDEKNSDNKKNNTIYVDDGTIIEINPNMKSENSNKLYTSKVVLENRFKCMICSKLFTNKKELLQHSLYFHATDLTPGWNAINCKVVKVKKKYNYDRYVNRERFECLICCSHHVTKAALVQHSRLFHPSISNNKFLCRFITPKNIQSKSCLRCNMVLANYNRYRKHIQKHVSSNCEECDMKFNKLNELKEHLKTHKEKTVKETYKCMGCNKEFAGKLPLYIHEQIHKIPKDVSCSKCNKPFTSEFELKRHERNYHTVCLCDICGKTYEIKYIRHHLETHNINNPFKCKLCTRSFKTGSSLSKHKKTHFPIQSKNTMCQICGKLFRYESISLHMRTHTGERPEVCEICGAAFRRKDHLRNHKKTHEQAKIYQCPLCYVPLFSKLAYKNHIIVVHEGSKPASLLTKPERIFTCVICQREFKQKLCLEDHYRMHDGERIYSCDICSKAFGTKIVLLQHKKTHIDYEQLPYQCDICKKKFRRSENLRNHRRVHTGEKPFPCPICQRPFRVRGEMVKHMRIHKRNDERVVKKHEPPKVVSDTDNSSDLCSVHDSNSFEAFANSNMPSLN